MNAVTEIWSRTVENPYFRFLLILALTVVVALLARIILRHILKPLAARTKTKIDDIIIKSLSSILFYILVVIGFRVAIQHFTFETRILANLVDSVLILVITILALRIITAFSTHWLKEWAAKTKSTADDRLIPLVAKILKTVVIILAFIFLFDTWEINISPLLTTAGIAGLALGFAVRDTLANILGGVQLVLDRTFKVGDKVELDSGEMGVILDIGLRSTKLRTFDNEVIYIPNGQLANAKLKNFTVPDLSVRVNVNFGVEYGSDPEQVRQVVLEAIRKVESVIEDPAPEVQFLNMSDFSLDFVARAWVKSYTEAYSTKLKLTDEIYRALSQAKIGIPFPTRTVYMKSVD